MITPAQMRVLKAIERLMKQDDMPPSYALVAAAAGLRSGASVHKHVHALAEHGIVSLAPDGGHKRIVGVVPAQSRNGLRWNTCEAGHQEILFQGRPCPLCSVNIPVEKLV